MEQLLWLPTHQDLGAAIGEAKRETDPLARLEQAKRLAGFRRDFTQTARLDRLANDGLQAVASGETTAAGLRPLRIALLAKKGGVGKSTLALLLHEALRRASKAAAIQTGTPRAPATRRWR